MMLEALHCYSILAYVVRKGGLLTKVQNIVVGWVGSASIVLIVCSKCFEDYGGDYHCWLQLDKMLIYGQIAPIVLLWFITFTLIEAAGQASEFRKLPGVIEDEITSGKIVCKLLRNVHYITLKHCNLGSLLNIYILLFTSSSKQKRPLNNFTSCVYKFCVWSCWHSQSRYCGSWNFYHFQWNSWVHYPYYPLQWKRRCTRKIDEYISE